MMAITKADILRNYPHRVNADGTGKFGCPVCCGDGRTTDPRFGGKVVDKVVINGGSQDYNVYECLACPVWRAPTYRVGDRVVLKPFDGTGRQRAEVLEVTAHEPEHRWDPGLVHYMVQVDEEDREPGDVDGLSEGVTEEHILGREGEV